MLKYFPLPDASQLGKVSLVKVSAEKQLCEKHIEVDFKILNTIQKEKMSLLIIKIFNKVLHFVAQYFLSPNFRGLIKLVTNVLSSYLLRCNSVLVPHSVRQPFCFEDFSWSI